VESKRKEERRDVTTSDKLPDKVDIWRDVRRRATIPAAYEKMVVRLRDMAQSFPLHSLTFATHPWVRGVFRDEDLQEMEAIASRTLETNKKRRAEVPLGGCDLIPIECQREIIANAEPLLCVIMAHNNPATSEASYYHLFHLLQRVYDLELAGDVVELGCFEGVTSAFMQAILKARASEYRSPKTLHVYDSFRGVPQPVPQDGETVGGLQKGDLAVGKSRFCATFRRYDIPLPEIHEGFFEETLPTQLPETICFAYLDGDMYSSIKVSLEHVYPRLVRGAIVVIDDYADPEQLQRFALYPGVKRACDDFLVDKAERVKVLPGGGCPNVFHGWTSKAYGSHGVFQKL
jgi:O-methyltransferase